MKWILEFLSLALNRIRSSFRNIFNYGGQNIPQPKNEPSNHISYENNNQSIGRNMNIHQAIEQNQYKEALKLIAEAKPDDVNATNELGQTPLHLAITAESLGDHFTDFRNEIIDALITKGANVNAKDKDGETPVHYISRWLLNNRSDEKVKGLVSSNGDKDKQLISSLKLLIDNKKADVNIENNKSDTALDHILKSQGYNGYEACNTIETLLKAGAQIKTPEQAFKVIGGSILHSRDSLEMVKLAISKSENPFDINYKNQDGNTALSLAYEKKKFDVANFLIEKGANSDTIILSTGKSFITHVIEDNLFDSFPSLNYKTTLKNGFTPLTTAVNSGNYDSVKRLVEEHKADVNFSDGFGRKAIHYAAARGDAGIIKYLLQHDADINSLDGNGNTTLHYAAANTNENIDFLIQKGINVNCQNKNGIRPIYDAIANNHFSNFQTLLNHGASLEMQDFKWVNKIEPLFVIIALMHELLIAENLLKDERVDHDNILNHQYDYCSNGNQSSGTILHWVAENNKLDIFNILKPYIKGEHINDKHKKHGLTPFHSAVTYNNVEMVESLLEIHGIDVNALYDRDRSNAIICAKNSEMVLLLIEANVDIESELGKQCLARTMIKLVRDGGAKSLEKLLSDEQLKNKIDVNARDNNNITILEFAAWQGDIETLKILAKYGADANLRSINEYGNGEVILHNIAQKYSNPKYQAEKNDIKDVMILLILLFNADLTLKDNTGKTPLGCLKDTNVKQELENVRNLRERINKIPNIAANDFVLNLLEKDHEKPIADHVKDLCDNFDTLMNEHIEKSKSESKDIHSAANSDCTKSTPGSSDENKRAQKRSTPSTSLNGVEYTSQKDLLKQLCTVQ